MIHTFAYGKNTTSPFKLQHTAKKLSPDSCYLKPNSYIWEIKKIYVRNISTVRENYWSVPRIIQQKTTGLRGSMEGVKTKLDHGSDLY